ncbi:transcriptional regulator, partial [Staphylococcus rostri]
TALVAYELYIHLTANDEVDEPFSSLDQVDLNDFRPEISD